MITIEDVKRYTLLDVEESFEPAITNWINQMTKHIEKETQRKFTVDASPVERVFDGNGKRTILIDDYTVLDSVEIDGTEINVLEYPANSSPKYILFYENVFPRGNQNITISARWGQEPQDDIKYACTVLVSGIVQNQAKTTGQIVKEKIGNYDVSYEPHQKADFDQAMQVINSYKNYSI